jgi:hypothetical protein
MPKFTFKKNPSSAMSVLHGASGNIYIRKMHVGQFYGGILSLRIHDTAALAGWSWVPVDSFSSWNDAVDYLKKNNDDLQVKYNLYLESK